MEHQRAHVVRQRSELGSWELATRRPQARLAGALTRLVGYEERSPRPLRRREVPQDGVVLILNLGAPLTVSGPGFPEAGQRSFVAAMGDSYALTEFEGVSRGVQVDLSPLAARMLFGVPMRELSTLVVDFEDVLGRPGSELIDRLHDAPSWERRLDLVEDFVSRRLDRARRPAPDAAWAWRRLRETGGRLPIGELTREIGCSRRHLVARFRDQVGPAPKTAARVLRFRRALGLLDAPGGADLARVAQDCGYYDQPHLNRDFADLAGTTPTQYLAKRLPPGAGVAA